MTQTSLSAAAPANKGNPCPATSLKWHRPARRGGHSCLPREGPQPPKGLCTAKPSPRPSEPAASLHTKSRRQFLIANPELEFNVTSLRINNLEFSNRKFSPIFYPDTRWAQPAILHITFPSTESRRRRPVILKAPDQDARSEGSQLRPRAVPPLPRRVKLLIETPRLEIRVKLKKTKSTPNCNRDK